MKHTLVLAALALMPLLAGAQSRGKSTRKTVNRTQVQTPLEPTIDPREEQMLEGLERVIVFDSLVVSKADLLSAYPLSESAGTLRWLDAECTNTEYVGSYGDVSYAGLEGDSALHSILCSRVRYGAEWSEPELVCSSPDALKPRQGFPFLLSDGVTLYFAQEDPDGLGGLDIYITRRGGENNQFYTPENMGFPYNSSANDYLLAIDEEVGIGMFASDRRQPQDSVCVYYFLPNDTRDTWSDDLLSQEERLSIAHLDSISSTWRGADTELIQSLRQRLAQHRARLTTTTDEGTTQRREALRSLAELEETLRHQRAEWHRTYQQGVALTRAQEQRRELILELEERIRQQRAALHVR